MTPVILGLDVGGANLKAATTDRRSASVPFPLWRHPDRLAAAVAELVAQFPDVEELAVTMTGELCDCYLTKREGVSTIVSAVEAAAGGRLVRVWTTDGRFVNPADARWEYLAVASANWHALAAFAGGYVPRGTALLIDIGSTTTDLIPILDGVPWADGRTDMQRLRLGELVYTGVRRTPATTLLGPAYAAELFATAHDAYLLLGLAAEDAADCDTADSKPATREAAHARLSRMLCGDPHLTSLDETRALAQTMIDRQRAQLLAAVRGLLPRLHDMRRSALHPTRRAVVSGSGEFLAHRLLREVEREFDEVLSLGDRLGPQLSTCAPAFAVADLARERRP